MSDEKQGQQRNFTYLSDIEFRVNGLRLDIEVDVTFV